MIGINLSKIYSGQGGGLSGGHPCPPRQGFASIYWPLVDADDYEAVFIMGFKFCMMVF